MITIQQLLSPLDTRTTLIGKTGTGKTKLVENILEYYKNVIVYDVKAMVKWPNYKVYDTLRGLKNSSEHRRIYRPNLKERRDLNTIDEFFFWIYNRGNTVLYIDEVANIGLKSNNEILDGYHAVLTMGREKGITVFQATQRPKRIPLEVLSETERFFIFWLNMEPDRERVAEILPIDPDSIRDLAEEYEFYFSDTKRVYGPYQLDLD